MRASHPFHRLSRQSPRFVFVFSSRWYRRRRRPPRLRCEERPFDSLPFRHRFHHRRRAERDARRRVTRFEHARAFLLVRHHGQRGRRETEEKKRTLEPAPLLFLSSFFSRRRRRRRRHTTLVVTYKSVVVLGRFFSLLCSNEEHLQSNPILFKVFFLFRKKNNCTI